MIVEVDFNELNKYWSDRRNQNLFFMMTVQNHLYDLLRYKGRVALNDLLIMLGVEPKDEYRGVGWVKTDTMEEARIFDPAMAEERWVKGFTLTLTPNSTELSELPLPINIVTQENH